jgi:hypothetical protein
MQLGRLTYGWVYNIKMDVGELRCGFNELAKGAVQQQVF